MPAASARPPIPGREVPHEELLGSAATPSRRALVIVNPYATTVSDRLRNLVVYALRARYEVQALDTQGRGHATEVCREAAHEGYDVVVAFGGDGTVNEAANGLAGSSTPLTCLPGGSTNVYCRMLGIPNEIVHATEHLLRLADDWRPRRVDLARVNGRHFLFSAGLGLDASVVQRVDARPLVKARMGAYFFTYAAFSTFLRRYLVHPPRVRVSLGARTLDGVTVLIQNGTPFTYFQGRPIQIAESNELQSGVLAGAVLQRASPLDVPTLSWRAFSRRAGVTSHRRVQSFTDVTALTVTTSDARRVPLQVDGDYIGEVDQAHFSVDPGALTVVA